MAYAIIGGMDLKKFNVVVDEPFEAQRKRLETELGVKTVTTCVPEIVKVCKLLLSLNHIIFDS